MEKNISLSSKNNDLSEVIKEISPNLSLGLKKNNTKVKAGQVVDAILYRLKTGRRVGKTGSQSFFYTF